MSSRLYEVVADTMEPKRTTERLKSSVWRNYGRLVFCVTVLKQKGSNLQFAHLNE